MATISDVRTPVRTPGQEVSAPAVTPWRRLLGAAPELAGLAGCAVLFAQAGGLASEAGGPGPAFFPRLVLALLAVGLGVIVVQQLRAPGTAPVGVGQVEAVRWSRFLLGVGLSLGYLGATYQFGWPIATAVFVVVFVHAAGKHNPLVTVPLALLLSLGLTYLFVDVVYVSLPTGVGVFDQLTDRLLDLVGIY